MRRQQKQRRRATARGIVLAAICLTSMMLSELPNTPHQAAAATAATPPPNLSSAQRATDPNAGAADDAQQRDIPAIDPVTSATRAPYDLTIATPQAALTATVENADHIISVTEGERAATNRKFRVVLHQNAHIPELIIRRHWQCATDQAGTWEEVIGSERTSEGNLAHSDLIYAPSLDLGVQQPRQDPRVCRLLTRLSTTGLGTIAEFDLKPTEILVRPLPPTVTGTWLSTNENQTDTVTGTGPLNAMIVIRDSTGQQVGASQIVDTISPWRVSISKQAREPLRITQTLGRNPTSEPATAVSTRPRVEQQPTSYAHPSDSTITFSAHAAGFPRPTVQWQADILENVWVDLGGQTSPNLLLSREQLQQRTPSNPNVVRVRAVFTNNNGTERTDDATYTRVAGPDPNFPADTSVFANEDGTLEAKAPDIFTNVHWQMNVGSAWKAIADELEYRGTTTRQLTILSSGDQPSTAQQPTRYRAVFSTDDGFESHSRAATLTPINATHPSDVTAAIGGTATFSVDEYDGRPTSPPTERELHRIAWEQKHSTEPNTAWQQIVDDEHHAGSRTPVLTITGNHLRESLTGQQYRAVLTTSTKTAVVSRPATLTITDIARNDSTIDTYLGNPNNDPWNDHNGNYQIGTPRTLRINAGQSINITGGTGIIPQVWLFGQGPTEYSYRFNDADPWEPFISGPIGTLYDAGTTFNGHKYSHQIKGTINPPKTMTVRAIAQHGSWRQDYQLTIIVAGAHAGRAGPVMLGTPGDAGNIMSRESRNDIDISPGQSFTITGGGTGGTKELSLTYSFKDDPGEADWLPFVPGPAGTITFTEPANSHSPKRYVKIAGTDILFPRSGWIRARSQFWEYGNNHLLRITVAAPLERQGWHRVDGKDVFFDRSGQPVPGIINTYQFTNEKHGPWTTVAIDTQGAIHVVNHDTTKPRCELTAGTGYAQVRVFHAGAGSPSFDKVVDACALDGAEKLQSLEQVKLRDQSVLQISTMDARYILHGRYDTASGTVIWAPFTETPTPTAAFDDQFFHGRPSTSGASTRTRNYRVHAVADTVTSLAPDESPSLWPSSSIAAQIAYFWNSTLEADDGPTTLTGITDLAAGAALELWNRTTEQLLATTTVRPGGAWSITSVHVPEGASIELRHLRGTSSVTFTPEASAPAEETFALTRQPHAARDLPIAGTALGVPLDYKNSDGWAGIRLAVIGGTDTAHSHTMISTDATILAWDPQQEGFALQHRPGQVNVYVVNTLTGEVEDSAEFFIGWTTGNTVQLITNAQATLGSLQWIRQQGNAPDRSLDSDNVLHVSPSLTDEAGKPAINLRLNSEYTTIGSDAPVGGGSFRLESSHPGIVSVSDDAYTLTVHAAGQAYIKVLNKAGRTQRVLNIEVREPDVDLANRFAIPGLTLHERSTDKRVYATSTKNRFQPLSAQPTTWYVYANDQLQGYFAENEAAVRAISIIDGLDVRADQLAIRAERLNDDDTLFSSDKLILGADFGIVAARAGDPASPNVLRPATEYYLSAGDVLIDHFNTDPSVNGAAYRDEAGETMERVIARINAMGIDATLGITLSDQRHDRADQSVIYATANNHPDAGDLYLQNINGRVAARAINPTKPLTIAPGYDKTFYMGYAGTGTTYTFTTAETRPAAHVADEINALNAMAHSTYLSALGFFADYPSLMAYYFATEPVQQLFAWNPQYQDLHTQMKAKYDAHELTDVHMSYLVLAIDHEVATIADLEITSQDDYTTWLNEPLPENAVRGVFEEVLALFTRGRTDRHIGLDRPLFPTLIPEPHSPYRPTLTPQAAVASARPNMPTQIVAPPSDITQLGTCLVQRADHPAAQPDDQAQCIPTDRFEAAENQPRSRGENLAPWTGETFIPYNRDWEQTRQGMSPDFRGQLEALQANYDTTHFFAQFTDVDIPTAVRNDQMIRARAEVERWLNGVTHIDGTVALEGLTQRIARLRTEAANDPAAALHRNNNDRLTRLLRDEATAQQLIEMLKNGGAGFQPLANGQNALQLVWQRGGGRLAAIAVVRMGTVRNHTHEFVLDSILTSPELDNTPRGELLGALAQYAAIKRLKSATGLDRVPLAGVETEVSKVRILANGHGHDELARTNKYLGFGTGASTQEKWKQQPGPQLAAQRGRYLFRGDTRTPTAELGEAGVFSTGFTARGSNTDIPQHLSHGPDSGFISTTYSREVAIRYSSIGQPGAVPKPTSGWVYKMCTAAIPTGVDIQRDAKNVEAERNKEIAVAHTIPAATIISAQKYVVTNGKPIKSGSVVKNPGFKPPAGSGCS